MAFDDLYGDVPREQREGLRRFREAHPQQHATIAGTDWHYVTAGAGRDTILWLVGGLKKADAAWHSISLLSDTYRIIAPDYPPLTTMHALADGLAGILDAEQVDRAHVLAGSFGGMLAQDFVRRHPGRVHKLILSTTAPPDAAQIERYQQLLAMVEAASETLVQEQAASQMFDIIAPPDSEADFFRAYLKELFTQRLDKADIASTYQIIIDFMGRDYHADDLVDWPGQILILDSDTDTTFGDQAQDALAALYPQAQRHTFVGAGHSPGSTQRDAYFVKVREFLDA